ncbi:hypothetical protein [Stetteria hydrogenophila]
MSGEELKRRIISLIDESHFQWRKAAFYSDPDVSEVVASLYERWERAGRRNMPIDYASEDELRMLAKKAEKYAFMDEEAARALAFTRMGGGEERRKGSLLAFLDALLGRRRGG